jgi:hypothetical protein
MYQVGDQVKYNGPNPSYSGYIGTVVSCYILMGLDLCDVEFDMLNGKQKLLSVLCADIQLWKPAQLPMGNQSQLPPIAQQGIQYQPITINELDNIQYGEGQFESGAKVTLFNCDCGGFKTYNTMDETAHSSWCSSRRKNERPKSN